MSEQGRKPIPAVAAVMVRDGKLLLIKRGVEPSKGKWSVPGGRVEWGETLIEAVKREVCEETGLEIEVGPLAGVYDLLSERPTSNVQRPTSKREKAEPGDTPHSSLLTHHYVIIDYFATPVGGELTPGDDAADARWVPLEDLSNYELTEHLRERLAEMGIIP